MNKLLTLLGVTVAGFLLTASSVFACGMTCHGDYHAAGSPGAVAETGRYDTAVCMGSVEITECPGGNNNGGGGGGGGGGGSRTDLTASNTTPVVANQGQSVTYSATVYNGSQTAGNTTTRFQTATDQDGNGALTIGNVATQGLSAYASRTVSVSYTHEGGSFYMRACADSGNTVVESNEANNCGPWSLVTISDPAPTIDLTASPESIANGASSVLRWVSANADVCSSTQFDTLGATSGEASVSPGETTLYSIICRKGGTGASGTYQYAFSDTSDLACPITNVNAVYTALPTCPSNPGGKACTTGPCKRNTISEAPGNCVINTDVYNCVYSSGTSAQQAQDSVTVAVTAAGTDLTAGSASAPGVARGRTVNVIGPIMNIGGSVAGASRAYYELVAPGPKSNASGVVPMGTIAASGSSNASFSYTFSTSGNYQVRFCADWYGEVPETNEGNNCGPWTDIAIPETPVSDSVSCNVSATSVTTGQSVTYTANPVGAATSPYTWTPSDGVGSYGSGQTAIRTFGTPGIYGMQLSATNAGSSANCPTVTVTGGYCSGSATVAISATPTRVRAGQTAAISWSASNVPGANASCTVTGPGISWTSTVSSSPQCSVTSSATVTVTTQSTYTLSCPGAAPTTVTVNVIPNFQEF